MVDVLFLQPPSPPGLNVLRDYAGGFGVGQRSQRPVHGHDAVTQPVSSLVYAYSSLRRLTSAAFLDAQAEHLDREELTRRVAALRPRAIVSALGLPSLDSDLALLSTLREATGAAVAVAGSVCRALPREVLEDGTADVAVSGDIEVVAPKLADALLGGTALRAVDGLTLRGAAGAPRETGAAALTDLDALPLPAFDGLPMREYRTWEFGPAHRLGHKRFGPPARYYPLYFSRGCPHGCRYCPYPLGFGSRWRRRSPERVVAEFSAAAAAGVPNVVLRDQSLTEDPGYLAQVCTALAKADLGVRWLGEARVGSVDASMLRRMRRAGCVRLHYGIETGDEDVFASYAKRGAAFGRIGETLQATSDAGILPSAHFLVGFPRDDWASVERTAELVRSLRISHGDCALMTPYPGTPAYEEASAEGRLGARDWSDFTGETPVLRLDALSPVELGLARLYILNTIRDNARPTLSGRARRVSAALRGRPEPIGAPLASLVRAGVVTASRTRPSSPGIPLGGRG